MDNIIFNTGETQKELNDYYNPDGSLLRKAQLRMLDMLLYVDKICKENNIDYRLDGGNVLGAVRHGGFIPWDDDVDIVVEEKDFPKLCKCIRDSKHPQYVLQTNKNDNEFRFWAILRDCKSEYIVDTLEHNTKKYRGLQIDIFPYRTGIIPFLFSISSKIVLKNLIMFAGKHNKIANFNFAILEKFIHPIFNLISDYFGNKNYYMHSYGSFFPHRFKKDILVPHKPIKFEGHFFPGPSKPKEFLKILYGDYMDLPKKNNRNHHKANYKIWD